MSILIKGMEMPKPGQIVLVEIDENGDVFAAYDGGRTKLTQHKAVPVPPHGRLIDADALKKEHLSGDLDLFAQRWSFLKDVNHAPTIIPAEEEDET